MVSGRAIGLLNIAMPLDPEHITLNRTLYQRFSRIKIAIIESVLRLFYG